MVWFWADVEAAEAVSRKNAGALPPAASEPSGRAAGWLAPRPSAPPVNPASRTHRSLRAVLLVTR
jgi:hypothetical protein